MPIKSRRGIWVWFSDLHITRPDTEAPGRQREENPSSEKCVFAAPWNGLWSKALLFQGWCEEGKNASRRRKKGGETSPKKENGRRLYGEKYKLVLVAMRLQNLALGNTREWITNKERSLHKSVSEEIEEFRQFTFERRDQDVATQEENHDLMDSSVSKRRFSHLIWRICLDFYETFLLLSCEDCCTLFICQTIVTNCLPSPPRKHKSPRQHDFKSPRWRARR